MSQRFAIHDDGRVTASEFLIGYVREHPNLADLRKPSKWFAVSPEGGIVSLRGMRDLAALDLARDAGYPRATLLDLDAERPH